MEYVVNHVIMVVTMDAVMDVDNLVHRVHNHVDRVVVNLVHRVQLHVDLGVVRRVITLAEVDVERDVLLNQLQLTLQVSAELKLVRIPQH